MSTCGQQADPDRHWERQADAAADADADTWYGSGSRTTACGRRTLPARVARPGSRPAAIPRDEVRLSSERRSPTPFSGAGAAQPRAVRRKGAAWRRCAFACFSPPAIVAVISIISHLSTSSQIQVIRTVSTVPSSIWTVEPPQGVRRKASAHHQAPPFLSM